MITDGRLTAAVEVTALRGGYEFNDYIVSRKSLSKALQPPGEGRYLLRPSIDFRLPVSREEVTILKSRIAAAAPVLETPGNTAPVLIPRKAIVHVSNPDRPWYVYCSHSSMNDVLRLASNQVEGAFWLEDDEDREHSFLTDAGRERAASQIAEACRAALYQDDAVTAIWDDEWGLTLLDEVGRGVSVVAVTGAVDARTPAEQDVTKAVSAKVQKFRGRRWADLNVLVLDSKSVLLEPDDVADVLGSMDSEMLTPLDFVIYTEGDDGTVVWGGVSDR